MTLREKYINHLIGVLGFDAQDSEELLDVYLGQLRKALLEIDQYLSIGAYDSLAAKFHQLKGTSGNLRLTEIADWMLAAENAAKAHDGNQIRDLMMKVSSHEILLIA